MIALVPPRAATARNIKRGLATFSHIMKLLDPGQDVSFDCKTQPAEVNAVIYEASKVLICIFKRGKKPLLEIRGLKLENR